MTQHGRGAADNSSRQIGPYELLQTLGSGGSAKVYQGRHVFLGTEAAVKVLHTPLDFEQVKQFVLEARTIANLEHPHIVRILGFDVENNIPFLAMQYAPQGSLRQHYPPGSPVPLPTVVSYVKQIAQALQYAHDRGVIHCDVKPENMLLGPGGEVLLSDFGIAVASVDQEEQVIYDRVGTLPYMAPEQINGLPCEASDQYSTAVVMYELLAGTRPFTGTDSEIIQ